MSDPDRSLRFTAAGRCHLSFAFEVGAGIDLDRAERILLETERQTVRSRHRVPQHFDYRPAPLRLVEGPGPHGIAGHRIERVDLVLYDFGAVAVNYTRPFDSTLESLVELAIALEASTELERDARERVQAILTRLADAVSRPRLAEPVEDYIVFDIASVSRRKGEPGEQGDHSRSDPAGTGRPTGPNVLWEEAGPITAQILRASREPLSPEEIHDALRLRYRFATTDVTIIDWNAAVLFDPDAEETLAVLEFANVQLLQLRHLDQELDRAVDRAYDALARTERGLFRALRPPVAGLRTLGELQMDGAVLFERVSNALKLVGDQFLSRVYSGISDRFHFPDWDRAVSRKLEVIDGVYQKLSDRVMSRRLELLEWIVILLIGLELVLSLLRGTRE
jgi:hypothetical protein